MKIDEWLSTPSSTMKFLQETFGVEKLEAYNKSMRYFCVEGSHEEEICVYSVTCKFSQHKWTHTKFTSLMAPVPTSRR